MKFLAGILLAAASCFAAGCPQQQQPISPPPDASDAAARDAGPATCATMCASLSAIGCAEGKIATCEDTCQKALSDPGIPDPPVACVSAAMTPDDVLACGMVCHTPAKP